MFLPVESVLFFTQVLDQHMWILYRKENSVFADEESVISPTWTGNSPGKMEMQPKSTGMDHDTLLKKRPHGCSF